MPIVPGTAIESINLIEGSVEHFWTDEATQTKESDFVFVHTDGSRVHVYIKGNGHSFHVSPLSSPSKKAISSTAYAGLASIARRLLPAKVWDRVLSEALADAMEEHADALAESSAQARWVRIRGYLTLWQTVVTWLISTTVGRMLRAVFMSSAD